MLIGAGAVALIAMQAPPPQPSPTAVIRPVAGDARLVVWEAGAVSCNGAQIRPVDLVRRPATLTRTVSRELPAQTIAFSIDAEGRARSIRRAGNGFAPDSDRAVAALAASRFSAGSERNGCTLTYTAHDEPVEEAELAELAGYLALREGPPLPGAAFDRLRQGDGCRNDTVFQTIVAVYPDGRSLSLLPGRVEWTSLRFDVSAAGEPMNPVVEASSGSAEVDQATISALRQSRLAVSAPTTGCRMSFRHRTGVLPAPARSDDEPAAPKDCPANDAWTVPLVRQFPRAFQSRQIEGWARVQFDVAPWGAIGNITVVEAQPAEDFGIAARAMLARGRVGAGSGATGCVATIAYRMEGSTPPDPAESDAAS
ncbi:MAG: hypothetical protein DI636_02955 [Pelagerythrobacter marensis]|nr:MAG: hypothetical protein DI636_02955 [Pelagerythrobacter marensis]